VSVSGLLGEERERTGVLLYSKTGVRATGWTAVDFRNCSIHGKKRNTLQTIHVTKKSQAVIGRESAYESDLRKLMKVHETRCLH